LAFGFGLEEVKKDLKFGMIRETERLQQRLSTMLYITSLTLEVDDKFEKAPAFTSAGERAEMGTGRGYPPFPSSTSLRHDLKSGSNCSSGGDRSSSKSCEFT
jgi:hypothetical protein